MWWVLKHSSRTAVWSLDSRSFLRAPPSSSSSPLPLAADLSAARFPLPHDTGLPEGEHLLSSAAAGLTSRSATATALPE